MPLCSGYDKPRRQLLNNTNSEIFISKYGEFGGFFFKSLFGSLCSLPLFCVVNCQIFTPKKSIASKVQFYFFCVMG
jgi:hypothetical protein